jgi:hypothetical protein
MSNIDDGEDQGSAAEAFLLDMAFRANIPVVTLIRACVMLPDIQASNHRVK